METYNYVNPTDPEWSKQWFLVMYIKNKLTSPQGTASMTLPRHVLSQLYKKLRLIPSFAPPLHCFISALRLFTNEHVGERA